MMQVNDEYAAVKDMPLEKSAGGAKPGDYGLEGLRIPASQQPITNSGVADNFGVCLGESHICALTWGIRVDHPVETNTKKRFINFDL